MCVCSWRRTYSLSLPDRPTGRYTLGFIKPQTKGEEFYRSRIYSPRPVLPLSFDASNADKKRYYIWVLRLHLQAICKCRWRQGFALDLRWPPESPQASFRKRIPAIQLFRKDSFTSSALRFIAGILINSTMLPSAGANMVTIEPENACSPLTRTYCSFGTSKLVATYAAGPWKAFIKGAS